MQVIEELLVKPYQGIRPGVTYQMSFEVFDGNKWKNWC